MESAKLRIETSPRLSLGHPEKVTCYCRCPAAALLRPPPLLLPPRAALVHHLGLLAVGILALLLGGLLDLLEWARGGFGGGEGDAPGFD